MKPSAGQSELIPLRYIVGEKARETRILELLKNAWPYFVGPGHARSTHPISIRGGILLVGCCNTSILRDLRASAAETWGELSSRIESALNVRLTRIEIIPSDPEPATAGRTPAYHEAERPDPLYAVLEHYRRNSKK